MLDLLSYSSLSAFAVVALAIAVAYLLVSTVFAGLVAIARARWTAPAALLHQPGAFIRRELESIDRRYRRHGTAALLFFTCLGILVVLGRRDLWADLPTLGWAAIAVFAVVTLAYAAVKSVQLAAYRLRLRSLLDVDLAVAQRLGEVQLRGHRLFHSVPVGDLAIDHVVVGSIGVFAAQVVLPPRRGAESVRLERGALIFEPDRGEYSLQQTTEAIARLTKDLTRVVGHLVKVVPTLIAPGCRVLSKDDDRYLLTNAQNCVTLVGWKDTEAYLMDDEIAKINEWLATRCQAQRRWFWHRAKGMPHANVRRPGLV